MVRSVYAIAGGKGGVGKTTTAMNLSTTLRATGRAVALVDADLTMPNLQSMMGLSHTPTIHDVLAGTSSLAEACAERVISTDDAAAAAGGQLDVYPGAHNLDAYGNTNPARLESVVDTLTDDYDVVILDTGTGLSRDVILSIQLADSVVVVTTPTEVVVTDARKTAQLVTRLNGTVEGVVVSRTCEGLTDAEIDERFETERLTTVPNFATARYDVIDAYHQLAVRLCVGKKVSTQSANILKIDSHDLLPFFVGGIQFDPGRAQTRIDDTTSQSTATTNGDAIEVINDTTEDTDDATEDTDDATEDADDELPDWFTGRLG